MPSLVETGLVVLEKKFPIHVYYYFKIEAPGVGPYMTLGTLFEQP